MTIEKRTGYFVFGYTGSSCYPEDRFFDGPYTEDQGIEELARHEKYRTIKSEYSDTGIYKLIKAEYEVLEDGRFIIANRVFPGGDHVRVDGHEVDIIDLEIALNGTDILTAGTYSYC